MIDLGPLVPVATFVAVIGGFVLQVLDRRRRNAKEDARDALITATHDLVNSISIRKDAAQKGEAFAQGKAAGVASERASQLG